MMGDSRKSDGSASGGGDTPETTELGPRRTAVVVGVDDYEGTVNTLPSSVADARAVADLLQTHYGFSSVQLLLDREATGAAVSEALDQAFSGASPQDRLVFYFSGHGSTALRAGRLEEGLVLHDGVLFDDRLVALSHSLPPGILTVVVDACFSAGIAKPLLTPQRSGGLVIDRARVKAFTRVTPEAFAAHADAQEEALVVKAFGRAFRPAFPDRLASLLAATVPAEPPPLNGLLVAASGAGEIAAAATTLTKGRSAFTFALLETLARTGSQVPAVLLIDAVRDHLARLGFDQRPTLTAPSPSTEMIGKAFITVDTVPLSIPRPDGTIPTTVAIQENIIMSYVNAVAAALVDLLRQQNDHGNANPLISALNANAQFGQRQPGSNDSILAQALARGLANNDNLNQQGQNDILARLIGNALGQAGNRNQQGQNDILAQAVRQALNNGGNQGRQGQGGQNDILVQAVARALANGGNQNQQNQQNQQGQNDILAQAVSQALGNSGNANRNQQQGQNDILAQVLGNSWGNNGNRNQQGQNDILAQVVSHALSNNGNANRNQQGQNDFAAQFDHAVNNNGNGSQQGQNDILTQALSNALANAVSRNFQQGAGSEGGFGASN